MSESRLGGKRDGSGRKIVGEIKMNESILIRCDINFKSKLNDYCKNKNISISSFIRDSVSDIIDNENQLELPLNND